MMSFFTAIGITVVIMAVLIGIAAYFYPED
jgi:hypothetical protein